MNVFRIKISDVLDAELTFSGPLASGQRGECYVFWRRAEQYQTVADLDLESLRVPSGGVLTTRLLEVDESDDIQMLAAKHLRDRGQAPVCGSWKRLPATWVDWTDGLGSVFTIVVRLTAQAALLLEYSIHGSDRTLWAPLSDVPGDSLLGCIDRVQVLPPMN